jgi:hypothetical protein
MNFKNMTKQQLKEYGETIGVKLDLRKKKDILIEELNRSAEQEEVVQELYQKARDADSPTIQTHPEFDIKQYIWLIIFAVLLVVVADGTNFAYAAGVVTSWIVKDGLILTLLAWVIMTKFMKRESWEWYDWLNALAYTTVIARIIYTTFFN